ncbi:BIG1-domain-containing protein [Parathielavia appendiculata]|uniref:Protein BIG1 n=1 Tax=Parathielavia appendiculata TaxID=2587402 RepID=A0AAN6TWX4_9PEZI|nr:BIG1-domain-containing protein [Parathielavia appendiculata]
MKLPSTAAVLAYAFSQAQAFSDSSPFILFSTAKLPQQPPTIQLQTSSKVLETAKSLLAACPTRRYILVSQPNMHAADLGPDDDCRMPNLCRAVRGMDRAHSWAVAEVIGQVSGKPLGEYVSSTCGADKVVVERVELAHLPAVLEGGEKRRGEVLGDNDYELGKLLDMLDGEDYTVMVFSDPNEFKAYEPEFAEPVHIDMKRWAEEEAGEGGKKKLNSTDNLPLFEKYQFFTPGIFMSFIVLVILLSILGVGLKALASLEVSYGAFDKDMGPAAQKKQM